ncbi:MAG: hypothetical protein EA364_09080 [Balneolaceae bacterium]|nr:MAG: hypothetical protein EA364_09080 [Balneolaceae bacterium]
MRITQNIIFDRLFNNINKNRSALAKLQDNAGTGLEVRKPSDGPARFASARQVTEVIERSEQYQLNVSAGLRDNRMAQNAVQNMTDQLIDFKRIAIQGATATLSENDRKALADEIAGIRENLVAEANTRSGNRHLFGGTNTSEPPFMIDDTATGGVADTSNTNPVGVRISDSVSVDISVTGTALRETPAGDLFERLLDVESALRNNEPLSVSAALDDIDVIIDHVTRQAAHVGNSINRMEFMYEKLEFNIISQSSEKSRLVDTDYMKTMSEVTKYQVAFEAALSVNGKLLQTSLLNYLRM